VVASTCLLDWMQIRTIDRVCEIPHEGPFCDLMWSDPEDIDTWAISPRGAGWLFGRKVTQEFNQINGACLDGMNACLLVGKVALPCCQLCVMEHLWLGRQSIQS